MSIGKQLSCVFYSWTTGVGSFVKTATGDTCPVLIAAANSWIKQTAEAETEPVHFVAHIDLLQAKHQIYLLMWFFTEHCR